MLTDIFRFIFDMATDPLSLPINPLYEWAILGVIGIFAYHAAESKYVYCVAKYARR